MQRHERYALNELNCLFIIQGEGRGHLTQAMALESMLLRAGHRVCSAVVSKGATHEVPAYFEEHFQAPVTYVESAHFVVDPKSQRIDWPRTLAANSARWNQFSETFTVIGAELAREKPDVVINFYEPLGGLYMMRHNPRIPMVAIAHQFMFLHPRYIFAEGFAFQRHSAMLFTRLAGWGATRRLALSLYDAKPLPAKRMVVTPPLLRDELFAVTPSDDDDFFLVYLFHHSLAGAVSDWHRRNPHVPIHCYWNNPEADETEVHGNSLVFHRLHGRRFLEMMGMSKGVVTTSGFESLAEAMYLGKPALLNPVRNHFEQYCNAKEGARMGAAVYSDDFNLSLLERFIPDYRFDAKHYRRWVLQAEHMLVQQVESVVLGR